METSAGLRGKFFDGVADAGVIRPRKVEWRLDDKELLARIEDIAARLVNSFTDAELMRMAPTQKGILLGILIDKRQILRGQPTAILSIEDRRNLLELVPALVREVERRGLIDVTPAGPVIEAVV